MPRIVSASATTCPPDQTSPSTIGAGAARVHAGRRRAGFVPPPFTGPTRRLRLGASSTGGLVMDARQLFLADHARLHAAATSGSADVSFEDALCHGLADDQLRARPEGLN